MIYPVPEPGLPFLGVHLTPMIGGYVTVGPNAMLGLAREGYPKGSVTPRDRKANRNCIFRIASSVSVIPVPSGS